MNDIQCLKKEGMQGWAVLAILKSWEYAYLRWEVLFRGPAMAVPFSPREKVLQPLPGSSEGAEVTCARWVLTFHCCPHPSFALLSACRPWCSSGVKSSAVAALLGCILCLCQAGWIRRGDTAFVMICFVSAGLSPSAVTSPQNIQLFVLWLLCSSSILAFTEGHYLQM